MKCSEMSANLFGYHIYKNNAFFSSYKSILIALAVFAIGLFGWQLHKHGTGNKLTEKILYFWFLLFEGDEWKICFVIPPLYVLID